MGAKEEKHHTEILRDLLPDFPAGEICSNRNDPPDIEIVFDNKPTCSIEHTLLFRPPDKKGIRLQSQESERFIVVEKACDIYNQRGGIPVYVSVHFREVFGLQRSRAIALSKNKRERLAETIADLVKAVTLEVGEETMIEPQPGDWKSWPEEIDSILVIRYEWSEQAVRQWAPNMGAVIPELTLNLIQQRIDAKEKHLDNYSSKYRANWLLLVELGNRFSSEFDLKLSQDALSHLYQSSFDRILLLRLFQRQWFELNKKPT